MEVQHHCNSHPVLPTVGRHPATRTRMNDPRRCTPAEPTCQEPHLQLGIAAQLGHDPARFEQKAGLLSASINEHLWIEEASVYGYFIRGTGELAGTLDHHVEAAGLAFVLMFGIADDARRARVLAGVQERHPRNHVQPERPKASPCCPVKATTP